MTAVIGTGSTVFSNGLPTGVSPAEKAVTGKAEQTETILDEYRNQGVELELSGAQPAAKENEDESRSLIKMYQEQAEAAKESAEAMGEEIQDMGRALEIARRISNGDHVPASDEKFLMDYNKDLYLGAKSMQTIVKNDDPKDYKSILEEDEEDGSGVVARDGDIAVDASGLNLCREDTSK